MMGRAHFVIGTGVTLSILKLSDMDISLPVVVAAAVSSVLADIDTPHSLIVTRMIPKPALKLFQGLLILLALLIGFWGQDFAPWNYVWSGFIGFISFFSSGNQRKIIMIVTGASLILFAEDFLPWNILIGGLLLLTAFLPHRGLTHTIYAVCVWGSILFVVSSGHKEIWVAGVISYVLHLLADAFTDRGIRLLPPFKWRLKLRIMSTGSLHGSFVEYVFIGLTLLLVCISFNVTSII